MKYHWLGVQLYQLLCLYQCQLEKKRVACWLNFASVIASPAMKNFGVIDCYLKRIIKCWRVQLLQETHNYGSYLTPKLSCDLHTKIILCILCCCCFYSFVKEFWRLLQGNFYCLYWFEQCNILQDTEKVEKWCKNESRLKLAGLLCTPCLAHVIKS